MEKRVRAILVTTAVILAVMFGIAYQDRDPDPIKVETATARAQNIYNSITAQGSVQAAKSVAVSPYENAVVTAVYAKEGDKVEAGDIMCTLTVENPSAGRPIDLQNAWELIADTSVQVTTAEEKETVRTPISGTVMALPQVGERVWTNVPCLQVADLEALQVRARIPEIYADDLRDGQTANISAAALKDKVYRATVKSVAPVAVRTVSLTGESREATVEAVLPLSSSAESLRPGYTVTAKIFTDFHADAIVVPYEAVCQRGEQEYVFCVEDGRAVQRAVTTGYMLEKVTEVVDGLQAGEIVILAPKDDLTDGTRVEIKI